MIRNIIFDMGNVVIRFDPAFFLDRAGITDLDDRMLVLNELFRSVQWAQMDLGILTEEAAEPLILRHFPERLWETVRTLLYKWAYPRDMVSGMEELISRLKKAGYGIYLLSNASVAQHDYWPRFPVSRLFDGKLISCDVHVVKPCQHIYHLFTEKFSLNPEECVFIDDSPANVAGAVACGWQGIVFHGSSAELEQKLGELGIRF
jgi:putative hydrolase of the HAD superfamily